MPKNPRKVNFFLIVYLILYLSLSLGGGIFFDQEILTKIIQILPVVLGILYLVITKQPVLSSIKLQKIHPLTIPCIILFTLSLWPLITLVNMISLLFSHNLVGSTVSNTVYSGGLIYALISMALLPAIVEEFTFRGILFGQYRCQRPVKAILLSALCFGLMHMNFNQFAYAFVLGIFLALLVEATGSLLSSILMHFIFNSSSIFMVYVNQKLSTYVATTENTQTTVQDIIQTLPALLPLIVVGCILAVLLFHMIAKLNHRDQEIASWFHRDSYQLRPNIKVTNICFYCYVIICLIICIFLEIINSIAL